MAAISEIRKYPKVHIYYTGRQGAPQARNFGAAKASGDLLLFADAHLEFRYGWGPKIASAIEFNKMSIITPCITKIGDDNSRGCGFKWTNLLMAVHWLPDLIPSIHEIPFACGCCMAIEKKLFYEIGEFDSGTKFWGDEDSEMCMRSWLMGHRVLCDPSIRVGHMFRSSHPYVIHWSDIIYNKIRFAFSHFGGERLISYLKSMSGIPDFSKLLIAVIEKKTNMALLIGELIC